MRRISVSKSPTCQPSKSETSSTKTHPPKADAWLLIEPLPTCPIPEIARLGRTLRKWKDAFLAYFDTAGASNAPHRSHQQTSSN